MAPTLGGAKRPPFTNHGLCLGFDAVIFSRSQCAIEEGRWAMARPCWPGLLGQVFKTCVCVTGKWQGKDISKMKTQRKAAALAELFFQTEVECTFSKRFCSCIADVVLQHRLPWFATSFITHGEDVLLFFFLSPRVANVCLPRALLALIFATDEKIWPRTLSFHFYTHTHTHTHIHTR